MIDFKYCFTRSGRVRINGKVLSRFELGSFIHRHSVELGLPYHKYLHLVLYHDIYYYDDMVYFFKEFLKAIR